jgi:hypothetical protein
MEQLKFWRFRMGWKEVVLSAEQRKFLTFCTNVTHRVASRMFST